MLADIDRVELRERAEKSLKSAPSQIQALYKLYKQNEFGRIEAQLNTLRPTLNSCQRDLTQGFASLSILLFSHSEKLVTVELYKTLCKIAAISVESRKTFLESFDFCLCFDTSLSEALNRSEKIPINFLANLSVQLDNESKKTYVKFFGKHLAEYFSSKIPYKQYSTQFLMIFYNLSLDDKQFFTGFITGKELTILQVLREECENENEFSILNMENYFKYGSESLLEILRLNLGEEIILNFVLEFSLNFLRNNDSIQCNLVTEFYIQEITSIIANFTNSNNFTSNIASLIELLAVASSKEHYCVKIRSKYLAKNCVEMLKDIHRRGKDGEEIFAAKTKLRSGEIDEKDYQFHSVKSSLIRVIGNLSHGNKEIQDQVRISEGICVVLDCCNIDSRNPFITQWAVLAIRNLCENNADNQSVIAHLSQTRQIDASTLQQAGVTLSATKDCKTVIAPLSRD